MQICISALIMKFYLKNILLSHKGRRTVNTISDICTRTWAASEYWGVKGNAGLGFYSPCVVDCFSACSHLLHRWGDRSGGASGNSPSRLQCQPAPQQSCSLSPVRTPAETRQEQTQDQQCKSLCICLHVERLDYAGSLYFISHFWSNETCRMPN